MFLRLCVYAPRGSNTHEVSADFSYQKAHLGRAFHEQHDVVGSDLLTNTVEHLIVGHVFPLNVSERNRLD